MSEMGEMVRRYSVLVGSLCLLTACAPDQKGAAGATPGVHTSEATSIDDYVLVDCMLPGQIRSLGTSMTFLTPRRAVKTTQRDCAIRGGEFVLFDRSNYATALQTLLPEASSGDATAQTYVAEIYEKGLGLPGPDYAQAAGWYRKAAEQGYSPAQASLGSLYERGLGVPKDKAKALDWYRKSTGLSGDRLVFESALKAEREAFQREIALRNSVATSLRQQLSDARSQAAVASARPAGQASAKLRADEQAIAHQLESQRLDAEREAEIRDKKLHALKQIKASGKEQQGEAGGKAAQAGKLELSLLQQRDALIDNSRRLATR